MRTDLKKIKKALDKWRNRRVLVVGDLILDHYVFGRTERISPEAPVPVIWADRQDFVGGGAVNVALNLMSLGAEVSLCGVVGNDHFGENLLSLIADRGIDVSLVFRDKERPTTLKTRILAQHQQVVRVDWESKQYLHLNINRRILKFLREQINMFDGIIIEDYGKGVVNPALVKELVGLSKDNRKVITVDPKEEHFNYYKNVTALTPNMKEAQTAANKRMRSEEDIDDIARSVMNKLKPEALLMTMGEKGMRLFSRKEGKYHIPACALEVYDVTGAGDTVIAVFTMALMGGASFLNSAVVSNVAAGIVVGKLGAAVVSKDDIMSKMEELDQKVYKL